MTNKAPIICKYCGKTYKSRTTIYKHEHSCKNKILKNDENNIDISINEIHPSHNTSLKEMWGFMFWLSDTKQYMIYTLQEFEDIYKIYKKIDKEDKEDKEDREDREDKEDKEDKEDTEDKEDKEEKEDKDEKVISYNKINLKNIFEFSLMQILLLYFVIISSFA